MNTSRAWMNVRSATTFFLLPFLVLSSMIACAMYGKSLPMEEEWGVRVMSIRLSAEGYMLDFRYRVLNAEKAAPLFDRKNKAYLIDQASGAMFLVPESPKVGALRTTRPPIADRNYFIFFANPGRYVKKGSKVTVVIGDFRVENLVVE